jgi:hypothetical protein
MKVDFARGSACEKAFWGLSTDKLKHIGQAEASDNLPFRIHNS